MDKHNNKEQEQITYDFGGSEYPYDDQVVVVDIKPPESEHKNKYIKADVSVPGLKLEPADMINVSLVLRYIGTTERKEITEQVLRQGIKYKELEDTARNIDQCLKPGGMVRLFDYIEFLTPVLKTLCLKGYTVKELELVNTDLDGSPLDWYLTMIKEK